MDEQRAALDEWAAEQSCQYCGHKGLRIVWRLRPSQIGTFSLSGAQMKVSARDWPWAVCDGCGHESRGEVE